MENTPSSDSPTSGSSPGSGSGSNSVRRVKFADEVIQRDVTFVRKLRIEDTDGFDKILLRSPLGSSAKVRLYGGQVVSWITYRGDELLFNCSNSSDPPNPPRGGIQVCFPQFGKCDRLDQHGFARNKMWEIEDNSPPLLFDYSIGDDVYVDLIQKPTEEEIKNWPYSYELRLRVALAYDGKLTLIPRVKNMSTDPTPLVFTFALHTHFLVTDISEVRVDGIGTLKYIDNLKDQKLCTEHGDTLIVESEMDRIYKDSSDSVTVNDRTTGRTVRMRRNRLRDVPVWNPWEEKEKTMPEFEEGDYKRMVCVGGAVVDPPVSLKAEAQWKCRMVLEYFGAHRKASGSGSCSILKRSSES